MKPVFIYKLIDPRDNRIRYVGKTTNKISYRLSCHISEAKRRDSKSHKNSWIISLLNLDLIPIIELLDTTTEEKWEQIESHWISKLKEEGNDLTNLTDGGQGNKNQYFSKESKEKKRNSMTGRIFSEETKKKISDSHKGKKLSDITKEKLRIINTGKKHSMETRLKRAKAVYQKDKIGNIISEFRSLREAHDFTRVGRGAISNSCSGRCKTAGGFHWSYKNEDIVESDMKVSE